MATDSQDHPVIREGVGPEKVVEERDLGNDAPEEVEDRVAGSGRVCPRCGWGNTRLSHTHTTLDSLLQFVHLRAFRCRTCGGRFRAFYRAKA